MRRRAAVSLAVCLAALVPAGPRAVAATVPAPGVVDARVRVVAYRPDDVIVLRGYVGYQIHLQWAEGEEFVNLGSGDSGAFDVGSERNHFFIKPKQEHAATNLTVLTNRRAYHFEYVVDRAPPPRARTSMIYSLRFTYPDDEARRVAAEAERAGTESRIAKADQERSRNTDYWFCGSRSLQPISAYDDGVQTHLRFGARAEFPAIFVRNDDKSESLVNFNVVNDEVVVHRVAQRLVLRRGDLVGCVVNQAFAGGGERPPSNTNVPGVARVMKGGNP